MEIQGLWLLCREHRGAVASRLQFLEDGTVQGGTLNESRWEADDETLAIYGSDGDRRFSFPLASGRGGELTGDFYPFEAHAPALRHFLRPLGPAVPVQRGLLPVTTSDPMRAAELAQGRVDFSFVLAPAERVRTTVEQLSFDACNLDTYQSVEFLEREYEAAPFFVHVLHDVDLICGSVVVRRDGVAVGETLSFVQNRIADTDHAMSADWNTAYLPQATHEPSRWPGSAFLLNTVLSNFGHWHVQSACNARAYQELNAALGGEIAPLSLNGVGTEHFRADGLRAIGISPDRLTTVPRDPMLSRERFARLLVPSALEVPAAVHFHPQVVRALTDLKRPRTAGGERRLYLSRRDVGHHRGILNSDDLANALASLGFVQIVTSEMTYEEELQTFAVADIVVAPHGGGLTNMIAHVGGLKIFEMFHSKQLNGWYKNLAAICGHRYAAYCAEPPPEEAHKGWHASFEVDVRRIIADVSKFLAR